MDDSRQKDAVLAAAEVFERAHKLSASSWSSVPAERALTVEAVMDLASAILWPESDREQLIDRDDVDAVRARRA